MKKQVVKSVASFAVVLMVLSIIPYGAFALENGANTNQKSATNENGFGKMMPGGMRHGGAGPDETRGMGLGPAENITEENFDDVQAEMLNSITERIAELQSMYSNVSEAATAEDLQAVLIAERQANAERAGPGEKSGSPFEVYGPRFFEIENLTDKNFADVQTEMLDSLQNMTEKLEEIQTKLTEAGDEDRAEELEEKITEIQNLYAEISGAPTAAELKEIVFAHLQTQAIESFEKEIESLNARVTEDGNTNDERLEDRITEITALIADVEGAESLDELKEIMSSEMKDKKGPMQKDGRGNMPGRHGSMQDNSMDNGTEA
ncbi:MULTISPECIES: hypothetical protein [unclassified Methanosarcina]|uniref:hypothetical protein n=1 Tax=unclassified Methanosarcina TaxID=2644672 RepID=UPI000615F6AE|nr:MULTISPECIES: hypothetical protein [unclassified Methanosarcina]AKB18028.1 hypothetical protein MSWHS_1165 [Methanosarcina sp. WWM596]AKB21366.1 hypothetical protein MSWH1_1095 [Methanosarcina sp. WH1]